MECDLPAALSSGPSLREVVPLVSSWPRHVLVVEDDSPIRRMLVDLLQDAGYAVIEAADAVQALEQLRQQRPDLVVLDLMLPGMSGWEFLDRSRPEREATSIPVIVLSAIEGRSDYPASLGVAAWFTKPLDVPRFLAAIEQLADPAGPLLEHQQTGRSTAAARVLVVEDEVVIRDLLSDLLEQEGFTPEVAGSIEEATTRIADDQPDLILLDLMLPGASGWSFLSRRRVDRALARIPVLVLSAAPESGLLEAKELGADGFLSKPFDLDVLSALLRSFLR